MMQKKKAQMRANLLDDSAVFVAPQNNRQKLQKHQAYPQQPMHQPPPSQQHQQQQQQQPQPLRYKNQQSAHAANQAPSQILQAPPLQQQQQYYDNNYPQYGGYASNQGPPQPQPQPQPPATVAAPAPPQAQNYYQPQDQSYYQPHNYYQPPPQQTQQQIGAGYHQGYDEPPTSQQRQRELGQGQRSVSYQHQSYEGPQRISPPQHQPSQQRSVSYQPHHHSYEEQPMMSVPIHSFALDERESGPKGNKDAGVKEDSKILELEEKIQRLERVLAMQELESKLENKLRLSETSSKSSVISGNASGGVDDQTPPPLPPPPPADKKRGSSVSTSELLVESVRHSKASLIPSEKEESEEEGGQSDGEEEEDEEEDDEDDEDGDDEDGDDDEPPPSYEELEKSGSLTYSQSIYRTGFEKAGYQMDHQTPPVTARDEKSELRKILDEEAKKANAKVKANATSDNEKKVKAKGRSRGEGKGKSDTLMMKRKNPADVQHPFKTSVLDPTERPVLEDAVPPKAIANPAVIPRPAEKIDAVVPPTIRSNTGVSTLNTLETSRTARPVASASTEDQPMRIIKYTTRWSYEMLHNGVIQPVLPSKSKQSVDEAITSFRTVRDNAIKDYKQFTPSVQFYWAILLLETLSKSEVLSRMTIDGKVRSTPLSLKKLRKQRLMFLSTAIKVLEKLIQIAPNETRARLYLGDIYSGGIHPGLVERDEKHGFTLFWDAAMKQNDPVACYRIACCLESGVGCGKDIEQSIVFFEKGAALGDPSSMCQLGMMHFAGLNGCVQDISLSLSYHRQAYETLRNKDVMAYDALISSRSFQDARGALYTLAKLYQTDRQILCLTDMTDAMTIATVGELKANNVWCNKSKALKYYLEAAKLGHNESQACLGYYYSQGFFPTYLFKSDKESSEDELGDPTDARKSIYWFSKAAADGHVYAALGLARWYGSGAVDEAVDRDAGGKERVILKRDEQQAFLWGRKAADAGELVEAEYMIGVCFEQGFGVEKNLVMAANYYERSARKGYKKAVVKLRGLKR